MSRQSAPRRRHAPHGDSTYCILPVCRPHLDASQISRVFIHLPAGSANLIRERHQNEYAPGPQSHAVGRDGGHHHRPLPRAMANAPARASPARDAGGVLSRLTSVRGLLRIPPSPRRSPPSRPPRPGFQVDPHLSRCWLDRVPYDESRHLMALQKRGAPLLKHAAQTA